MKIYCVACERKVMARLTDGREIYPRRKDLHTLPFWKHDKCGNYVGCHHQTKNRTHPLGCIPTQELKDARKHIHALLDPLWQSKQISRKQLYNRISEKVGRQYHTANTRSLDEARAAYRAIKEIKAEFEGAGRMEEGS